MGTEVDPAALLRAAGVADRLADVVEKQVVTLEADTEDAARALAGFRTGQVLTALRAGWVDGLGRHRDYLHRLGDALADTAAGYRHADAESAARFRELDRY